MASGEFDLRLRNVDWRIIDGETIVLDASTERYLSLNRSGTLMWEKLVDGTTHGALVDTLVEGCGISSERARADIDAFVGDLRSHGLLDDASE